MKIYMEENIIDVVMVVNHILGQSQLEAVSLSLADMNNDLIIYIKD